MIGIKIALFFITIASVKFIFLFINDIGDKRIVNMKNIIDFADYLRIYSCDMKMPLNEILCKYDYKNELSKDICQSFYDEILMQDQKSKIKFINYLERTAMTPNDFNNYFAEIVDYYGNVYSDILDIKLQLSTKQMIQIMNEYERDHKEKKNLYNKISILAGCLVAVILI